MSEQHKGPPAGLTGTVDHQDAGDGWLVVRLLTKQAMLREGMHMDHCLGDGDYDELAGDEDLTSDAIWSLRDPDGISRATLDVRAGVAGRLDVIMAVGPRNRRVRRSDARRLQALVAAFRAVGVPLDFAGETGLVMADDGRVMREDQAPAEVRQQSRARHVARVVKLQRPQSEEPTPRGNMEAVEHAVADALHAATGLSVHRWCEREIRIDEPAVQIVATVETIPPDAVDISQDEVGKLDLLPYQRELLNALPPAGSWIGRIYANRMARMPPLGPIHASLLKEELWKRWDGDAIPSPTAGELD